MANNQIPKYYLAPTFSISPAEAGGPLELGSIIESIDLAEDPINKSCHIHIPASMMFCSHQRNFTASRYRMVTGECGVWARTVGVEGIGGESSFGHERSDEDIYHFESVDTLYFNPTKDYLEESMNQSGVKDFMAVTSYNPVFIVTGLKTARGPSVQRENHKKAGLKLELGLQQPGGFPLDVGPRVTTSKETGQVMGFEGSDDFIIGIRVTKVVYKKHWLSRTPRALTTKAHNKGATMVDNDIRKTHGYEVMNLGDEEGCSVETETLDISGVSTITHWVDRKGGSL